MRLIMFLALLAFVPSNSASAKEFSGVWLTQKKDAQIRIYDCGNGTPCGKLTWVDPATTDTMLDARNHDASKRKRRLIGVPIIWGYTGKKNAWSGGKIYNPEDGKTFRSSIKLINRNKIAIKGCLGPFCRTNYWTRVSPKNVK